MAKHKVIRLGASGALGRMGRRVLTLASKDKDFGVVLALERSEHPQLGEKIAGTEVVSDAELIKGIDCLIDFSCSPATIRLLQTVLRFKKTMVIGTTGLSQEQKTEIGAASEKIPIVFSPNMSIGVNLLFGLVRQAAAQLPGDYRASMSEAHHIHKKDAPSGTAKFLAQIIEKARSGQEVKIESIREGEIIGDHEVVFDSPWDTLRLSHSAKTRDIFALGALTAAKFAVGKERGLFSMADVLKEL